MKTEDKNYKNSNIFCCSDSILDDLKQPPQIIINGINTPFLYFGGWMSTFAFHTEDQDLYSINYLHFGAPKVWVTIAMEDGAKFEKLVDSMFKEDKKKCSAHIRHKEVVISPDILEKNGIRCDRVSMQALFEISNEMCTRSK